MPLPFDVRNASSVNFTADSDYLYIITSTGRQAISLSDEITLQRNGESFYSLKAKDIKAVYDLAKCSSQGTSPCLNDSFKINLESFKNWWSNCSSTLEQWSYQNGYCYSSTDRQGSNDLFLCGQKIAAEGNASDNIFTVGTDLRTLACGPTASIYIYGGQGQDTVYLKIDRNKVVEKHCEDGWVFITSLDRTIDIRLNSIERIEYLPAESAVAAATDSMFPKMIIEDHSHFGA